MNISENNPHGFSSILLGIIIVSYKTTSKTIDFVKQELLKINWPKKIIIVNNHYQEYDNKIYKESLDAEIISNVNENINININNNVYVINADENLGFAKGNNLGVKFLIEHFAVEYLLFCNNDIKIVSYDIIDKLVEKMMSNHQIGIIGPKVVNEHGVNVSPRYDKVSPFRYALWHLFYPIRHRQVLTIINFKSPGLREINKRSQSIEGFCYWVLGSFMLTKTDVFLKINGFDPGTFLYAEEKILAERLIHKGYKMYYYPSVIVLNEGGYTINRYLKQKEIRTLIFDSDLYYYKNYFKRNLFLLFLLYLSRFIYLFFYSRFYK